MITFNPKKPHMECHGPGADCAFIQDGLKFNGHGDLLKGQIEEEIEKPKKIVEKPKPVVKKEVCPYCGKSFKKLTSHYRWCKVKAEQDGRNAGEPDRQIEHNEPEIVAPGRSQTSYTVGRRDDS